MAAWKCLGFFWVSWNPCFFWNTIEEFVNIINWCKSLHQQAVDWSVIWSTSCKRFFSRGFVCCFLDLQWVLLKRWKRQVKNSTDSYFETLCRKHWQSWRRSTWWWIWSWGMMCWLQNAWVDASVQNVEATSILLKFRQRAQPIVPPSSCHPCCLLLNVFQRWQSVLMTQKKLFELVSGSSMKRLDISVFCFEASRNRSYSLPCSRSE